MMIEECTRWYLYGLSANPPTYAHYEIIKNVSSFAEVLTVIPTYKHPIKTNLIDFEHRFNMLKMLCDPLERVFVSRIEEQIQLNSTYELITTLRSKCPLYEDTKFVLVCDFFIMMDFLEMTRKHSEEILKSQDIDFCVILNNSNDILKDTVRILEHSNSVNKNIEFLIIDTIDESIRSSIARNNIEASEDVLPECVRDYIINNNIVFA